jgi:hypothetical protein
MKYIKLTKGKKAIVDDEDFNYLNQFKWHYQSQGYAARNGIMVNRKRGDIILMHRVVNETPNNLITDHINRNKLDNRKSNLRTVTYSVNHLNKNKPVNNTSGYKGVHWDKSKNKWRAKAQYKSKQIHLGDFDDPEKANVARLSFDRKFI